jgi:hypothetical protein
MLEMMMVMMMMMMLATMVGTMMGLMMGVVLIMVMMMMMMMMMMTMMVVEIASVMRMKVVAIAARVAADLISAVGMLLLTTLRLAMVALMMIVFD